MVVRLERGRILSFARLLGETDPLFTDVQAARAAGHPDVAAPPSFPAVVESLAIAERRRQGTPDILETIGADFRYLLHGEQRFAYAGLMYAGEDVEAQTQVVDFYDKRGGLLEFVVLESTVRHRDRGPIVRSTRTLVHRLR
ncbi:FAS1-like dehydratase domain-containing protein [Pseudonocardia sp. CA-107938]|uniref:FAS1-like dehydratase domain-containing protein n=1 Tax=Pseudonocardia sp. CA-107938 TaxID=3240021 RepID=UPI003D94A253